MRTRTDLRAVSRLAVATMLALGGSAAHAQSFQAGGAPVAGTASISVTATTTDVTINAPRAVINWSPTDTASGTAPIDFQTAGTTATFTNAAGVTDFAVLNRILPADPTRAVQFNGTVVSQLQSAAAGTAPGGTVLFYSPAGILLSPTAVFNVGNLVLTASDIAYDPATGGFGVGDQFVFGQANLGAQIVVEAGASVTASVDGSYIALVAPAVRNDGAISVNGSAALVAADAATITFSPSGLFDIQVDAGTSSSGTVLSNSGAIGGAASTGAFIHRVYMVAVPKNDAITMAIAGGSSLGFDVAGAADVVGNAVVLSAGYDVLGGQIVGGPAHVPSVGAGTGTVGISLQDANLTSAADAQASGNIAVGGTGTNGTTFASDLSALSNGNIALTAGPSSVISVGGALRLGLKDDSAQALASAVNTSGSISLDAQGGAIAITGNTEIHADAFGAIGLGGDVAAGSADAGSVFLFAQNGGSLTFSSGVTVSADGFGGGTQVPGLAGGTGRGGLVQVQALGGTGGTVTFANGLFASANGYACLNLCDITGGSGLGGTLFVQAAGASNAINVTGATVATADGGAGLDVGDIGASGTGGQVNFSTLGGGNLSLGSIDAFALGFGSGGLIAGGSGSGGSISLFSGGTGGGGFSVTGAANFVADGTGGNAFDPLAFAGTGQGGTITLSANDGTAMGFADTLSATARGTGGSGAQGLLDGTGGTVSVGAFSGATLQVGSALTLATGGVGGGGNLAQVGGIGTGGVTAIHADSAVITFQSAALATADGQGGLQADDGIAGDGRGGRVQLTTAGTGLVTFGGTATVSATGTGGVSAAALNGVGGAGVGGIAEIGIGGGQIGFSAALDMSSNGVGGIASFQSGAGLGGSTLVNVNGGGALNFASSVYLGSVGSGGPALTNIAGGNATGGNVQFTVSDGAALFGADTLATFEASAFGGLGAAATLAQGGTIGLHVSAGLAQFDGLTLLANGNGNQGVNLGSGGNGIGGQITIGALGDSRASSTISMINGSVSASGFGGAGDGSNRSTTLADAAAGGNGGFGQGGTVLINAAADGGIVNAANLVVSASGAGGFGGDGFEGVTAGGIGGNGGTGTGGVIAFDTVTGTGTTTGGATFGLLSLDASASGGGGGLGGIGPIAGSGGGGGSAVGGAVNIASDRGGSSLTVTGGTTILAYAFGGNGNGCMVCFVDGGSAAGGSVTLGSAGNTTGNAISLGGATSIAAQGYGGGSIGTNGANGTGGTILLQIGSGLALQTGDLTLEASGQGGDQFTSLTGGAGQGGDVQIAASQGGIATVSGQLGLYATGVGGSGRGIGSNGGSGTGGTATLFSDGGAISASADLTMATNGFGGSGDLEGGTGAGGNGQGGTAVMAVGSPAALGNGGSILVQGLAALQAQGSGGDGLVGGAGNGGFVGMSARFGSLIAGSVIATAAGFGGYGVSGGSGGGGTGGQIDVLADSALEGGSTVNFGALTVDASGFGGFGNGALIEGGTGGSGGDGTGGDVQILGSAGNGNLVTAAVNAYASGHGGGGGDGGGSAVGTGGLGGLGGGASGGTIQIGTTSGLDTGAINTGSAAYASITAFADALGGSGGAGGTGVTANGNGGAGGAAAGGGVQLQSQGALVTIGSPSILSGSATGGNGGAGAIAGTGGSAVIGASAGPAQLAGARLVVSNRFNQTAQRGGLTAGDLAFVANSIGGAGSVVGTSLNAGTGIELKVGNGDLGAANVTFSAMADSFAAGGDPASIALLGGTVTLAGSFAFQTNGALSLTLDSASLSAVDANIDAGNWVYGSVAPAVQGTVSATNSLSFVSAQDLVAYANFGAASDVLLTATGLVGLGDIAAAGGVSVMSGGAISLGTISAGGAVDLNAIGSVSTADITAGDSISVAAGADISVGNLSAGIVNPSAVSTATYTIALKSGGNITTGAIQSATDIGLAAPGTITTGALSGNDLLILGGGNIATGGIVMSGRATLADYVMLTLGTTPTGDFDPELVFAAFPLTRSTGTITVGGDVSAARFDTATAGGFTSGNIDVTGNTRLTIDSGAGITAGALSSAATIDLSAGGALTTGPITTTFGNIAFSSGGAMQVGNVISASGAFFNSQATLDIGNVAADLKIILASTGNLTSGSLLTSNQVSVATGRIEVASSQGVAAVGNIGAFTDTYVFGALGVTTGTITARDVLLLSGGPVSASSISAGVAVSPGGPTTATGRVMVADISMAGLGGTFANYDYNAVFNAVPVRTAGTVALQGPVIAGRFVSYSQGDMQAGAITAFGSIEVESGGLATVSQQWSAPDIWIHSSDIAIAPPNAATGAAGGLDGGSAGQVTLISLNPAQALIGDGLTGNGYALSNAEFGRVRAGTINVAAADNASQPVDMVIGTLDVAGSGTAANLTNAAGTIRFFTGTAATQTPGGTLRVSGNLAGTGFAAGQIMNFLSGTFELDAATGSVALTDTAGALSGIAEIHANYIHVASGSILGKLAADPFYAGVISDLNAPAAVQRPGGVLRALGLDFYPTNTLYIQNTGTTLDPAGFLAGYDTTNVTAPANALPASLRVIVNGKWQTATGTIGGTAARDLVANGAQDLSRYTADSQINGCALTVAICVQAPPQTDPSPDISSQIEILTGDGLADTPGFVEPPTDPTIDDSDGGDEPQDKADDSGSDGDSPIAPPAPLIDSRPLTPSTLIEQPVAGSGNPSLMGSVINENSAQGEQQ